jgi:hypothetical protein
VAAWATTVSISAQLTFPYQDLVVYMKMQPNDIRKELRGS